MFFMINVPDLLVDTPFDTPHLVYAIKSFGDGNGEVLPG